MQSFFTAPERGFSDMPEVTLTTLNGLKAKGEKITMLTCYDATFAKAASQAGIEVLLVGDSLGMVLQGHDSTLPVTTADMAYHTASVKRGNDGALILADLPFMAHATPEQAFANSATLMQAGAHMVKIEGAAWLAETIRLLAERGVPVCAHMGLTPQTVNVLGGYKVQGRQEAQARQMRADAIALEQAGAAMLLLECVPSDRHRRRQRHRWPGAGAARHARPVADRPGAEVREELHARPARYPQRPRRLRRGGQAGQLPR
jgi:3-methyl-2-oxobutanoate hydroxymethyltransferase